MHTSTAGIRLGLRENWQQFTLLVLVNAFVGTMVGVERSVLSLLAEDEFGVASATAALSFLIAFGLSKAIANFVAGDFAQRIGRRRILLIGWLFALPVPLLLGWAPSWSWVIVANLLLGVNQGLAWSATVIMKIDLVGPKQRGLAMGINEFAGYLAVALAALGAGYLAAEYGPRSGPVWIGGAAALLGYRSAIGFVAVLTAASGVIALTYLPGQREPAGVRSPADDPGQGAPPMPSEQTETAGTSGSQRANTLNPREHP